MINVVCFVKDDCGPSQQLKALLKNSNLTQYNIVNVESYPLQTKQGNVKAVPTVVVKDDDNILATFVGFSKTIVEKVEEIIKRV